MGVEKESKRGAGHLRLSSLAAWYPFVRKGVWICGPFNSVSSLLSTGTGRKVSIRKREICQKGVDLENLEMRYSAPKPWSPCLIPSINQPGSFLHEAEPGNNSTTARYYRHIGSLWMGAFCIMSSWCCADPLTNHIPLLKIEFCLIEGSG